MIHLRLDSIVGSLALLTLAANAPLDAVSRAPGSFAPPVDVQEPQGIDLLSTASTVDGTSAHALLDSPSLVDCGASYPELIPFAGVGYGGDGSMSTLLAYGDLMVWAQRHVNQHGVECAPCSTGRCFRSLALFGEFTYTFVPYDPESEFPTGTKLSFEGVIAVTCTPCD